MLLFKGEKKTYVLASEFSATLTDNDKPIAGVRLVRTITWDNGDSSVIQETTTTDNGHFSFTKVEKELTFSSLAHFSFSSTIEAIVNHESVLVWHNSKQEAAENSEYGGNPIENIVCNLSDEDIVFRLGYANVMTICRWPGMPTDWN